MYRNDGGLKSTATLYAQAAGGLITGVAPSTIANFASSNTGAKPSFGTPFMSSDYNVNQYTGAGSFSVPFHVFDLDGKSISIGLSYNGAGVKVREYAKETGLGWSFGGQPTLTRAVADKDDFKSNPALFSSCENGFIFSSQPPLNKTFNGTNQVYYQCCPGVPSCTTPGDGDLLNKLYNDSPNNDHSPDVYYLLLGDKAIKFMFDKKDGALVVLGENSCKIQVGTKYDSFSSPYGQYISSFTITADDGYVYVFGNDQLNNVPGNTFLDYMYQTNNTTNATTKQEYTITEWKIRKIISPKGNEMVFTYGAKNQLVTDDDIHYMTWINEIPGPYETYSASTKTTINTTVYSNLLTGVTTAFNMATFGYSTTKRQDFPLANALNEVNIFERMFSSLTKKFTFTYDHFAYYGTGMNTALWKRNNLRLKLTGITQTNSEVGGTSPSYSFFYDETTKLPARNNYLEDHWGYCNAIPCSTGNNCPLTAFFPPTLLNIADMSVVRYGVNKESDATLMKAGSLNKIVTATKGVIEIEYEANKYFSPLRNADKVVGGLRVKSITKRDADYTASIVNKINYDYKLASGYSSGVLMDDKLYVQNYQARVAGTTGTTGLPNARLESVDSLQLYATCNKYLNGYITTAMSILYNPVHASGATVGYSQVKETLLNGGYTINEYYAIPTFYHYYHSLISNTIAGIANCRTPLGANYNWLGIDNNLNYYRNTVKSTIYGLTVPITYKNDLNPPSGNQYLGWKSRGSFGETMLYGTNSVVFDALFYAHYLKNGLPKTINAFLDNGTKLKETKLTYATKENYNADSTKIPYISSLSLFGNSYNITYGYDNNLIVWKHLTPRVVYYPTSSQSITYSLSNGLNSQITNYIAYDSPYHDYPTRTITYNATTGKGLGTMVLYPKDYTLPSSSPTAMEQAIASLLSLNMLALPIEEVKFQVTGTDPLALTNYTIVSSGYTYYRNITTRNWSNANTLTYPVFDKSNLMYVNGASFSNFKFSNKTTSGASPWVGVPSRFTDYSSLYKKTVSYFDTYNKYGLLVQTHSDNSPPQSVFYGYKYRYVEATSSNSDTTQSIYSGFENGLLPTVADGWFAGMANNVSIVNKATEPDNVFGGRYSLKVHPAVTTTLNSSPFYYLKPATQSGKYKFSCWVKLGPGFSDGNTNVYLETTQANTASASVFPVHQEASVYQTPLAHTNWQYLEIVIDFDKMKQLNPTIPLYIRFRIDNEDAYAAIYVDDVRLHPVDAQMTTTNYLSDIGKISESGVDSKPVHYEYDGLGRLKYVFDFKRNMVQKHQYIFKQ